MPFASKKCACRVVDNSCHKYPDSQGITAKGNPSDTHHIKNVMVILNAANKLCSLTGTQSKVFITFNMAKQTRLRINHLCKPFWLVPSHICPGIVPHHYRRYQQNMMSLHSVNLSIFIIFWIKTNDILCDNHWSNRQTCSLYGAECILFWERSAFNPSCISHSLSPLHFDGLSQRKNYTYQIFYKSRGAPWLRAVHRPL